MNQITQHRDPGSGAKVFGLHLLAVSMLGIGLAGLLNMFRSGVDIRTAMGYGGFLAPIALAIVGGWRSWKLAPFWWASLVGAGLVTGRLELTLFSLFLAAISFGAANKLRQLMFFYLPPPEEDESA